MKNEGRRIVICGDYNIAHRDIDVYDPKSCTRDERFSDHAPVTIDYDF